MDQRINSFLETLVLEVLSSPQYVNLPSEQKNQLTDKIRDYLNTKVLELVIDRLTPQQLESIKDISASDPRFEEKIEEFSSQIPFLTTDLEQTLVKEVSNLKQNSSLLV